MLPALGAAPDVSFPAMQRATLSNGLKVILLERHTAPIVNVALAVDAGAASDSAAKAGTASLALDLLDKGTKTRDAFQMADALESLGAQPVHRRPAPTCRSCACSRPPPTWRRRSTLMADAALNPAFAADQFALQKQRRLAQIAQETRAAERAGAAHPAGPAVRRRRTPTASRPPAPKRPSASITREDLARWHAELVQAGQRHHRSSPATPRWHKLVPALEASFGGWKAGTAPAKQVGTVARTAGKKLYLIDKPDAPQSTIVAAHVSRDPGPAGRPGDGAGDAELRRHGHLAPEPQPAPRQALELRHLGPADRRRAASAPSSSIAPVQTDKTKESMLEVAKEIRGVAGERPLAGEEYTSIMRNMTSRLAGRFATLGALEAAARHLAQPGLPDNYWPTYAGNMRAPGRAAAGRRRRASSCVRTKWCGW